MSRDCWSNFAASEDVGVRNEILPEDAEYSTQGEVIHYLELVNVSSSPYPRLTEKDRPDQILVDPLSLASGDRLPLGLHYRE